MLTQSLDPVLDALGDGTRRQIIERLARGPQSVSQIARDLPVSRPAVSQHLARLLDAELVTVTSAGTRRIYALSPDGFAGLRRWLDGLWTHALANFQAAAEQAEREKQA